MTTVAFRHAATALPLAVPTGAPPASPPAAPPTGAPAGSGGTGGGLLPRPPVLRAVPVESVAKHVLAASTRTNSRKPASPTAARGAKHKQAQHHKHTQPHGGKANKGKHAQPPRQQQNRHNHNQAQAKSNSKSNSKSSSKSNGAKSHCSNSAKSNSRSSSKGHAKSNSSKSSSSGGGGSSGSARNHVAAAAPAVVVRVPTQHPLEHAFTIWYDRRPSKGRRLQGEQANYENNLVRIGSFATVEAFWCHFNHVVTPSALELNANLHIFKNGIKPMWEDAGNRKGGKWTMCIKGDRSRLNEFWTNLVLALIGEQLHDDVCGVVVSRRKQGDRIAVWNGHKKQRTLLKTIGRRMKQCVAPGEKLGIKIEYLQHDDSIRSGSSYTKKDHLTM